MMLFDLQSDKVNKIILCPIIKDIKKYYMTYGFSLDFLYKLFSGVSITKRTSENEIRYSMSLTIKDYYICRGLMLNNKLNGYPYDENYQEYERKLFEKIVEFYKDNPAAVRRNRYEFEFEEILNIVDEEELLCTLEWFENQVLYAIDLLEKYEDSGVTRKKKVSSILDEL